MAKKKLNEITEKTIDDCKEKLNQSLALRNVFERLASTGEDVKFESWELRAIVDAMMDPVDEVWDELDRLSMQVNDTKEGAKLRQVV